MRRERGILTAAVLALVVGLLAEPAQAIRLSATAIRIEINDTDGDAGIQMFVDGEGWDLMQVRDPHGNIVLNILGESSVGAQGLTELFFESAEPSFEEQSLDELLALFPEGFYQFRGRTTDGVRLRGSARLTHALPDGPVIVLPEEDEEDVDPDDTVVEWLPVADPPGSRISGYQVLVLREKPPHPLEEFSVNVPRTATSVTVPPEFMRPNNTYKVEVLAIERSGNQTITEHEFETGERGGGE
ncbi:MAG: fibronectin type III domain-containing protein [Thermoanaerobaculia bacterium]